MPTTPNQALIVAHGQPSEPAPAEAALARFAQKVAACLPDWDVRSATLAMPKRLETELSALSPGAVVYPMFMAKGWFVSQALPSRLGDAQVTITDPLGLEADLPQIALAALNHAATDLGWSSSETTILLAAHGSGRSPKPAQMARKFAADLNHFARFKDIHVGFVEEAPFVADTASNCPDQSLCLPLFACSGFHTTKDIPHALEQADFSGHLLAVLGDAPGVPECVADTLQQKRLALVRE